jgi:hypothetical protein
LRAHQDQMPNRPEFPKESPECQHPSRPFYLILPLVVVVFTPLVVSAGFLRAAPELAGCVIPLANLPAFLGPPGAPTGRIARAFEDLARRKAAWGQTALSARHGHWMAHGRRFDPMRAPLGRQPRQPRLRPRDSSKAANWLIYRAATPRDRWHLAGCSSKRNSCNWAALGRERPVHFQAAEDRKRTWVLGGRFNKRYNFPIAKIF